MYAFSAHITARASDLRPHQDTSASRHDSSSRSMVRRQWFGFAQRGHLLEFRQSPMGTEPK